MRPVNTAALLLAALALTACAGVPRTGLAESPMLDAGHASVADAALDRLAQDFITQAAALNPVAGTQMGDHRYDDQLPDITATGRARERQLVQTLLARLERIDRSRLSRDNQVNAALLENELRYQVWQLDTLQEWAWNPQRYNDLASGSLYTLVARDFAPWPQRFASIVERMELLPAFLAETRRQLVPARVPKVYAETVARQNAGLLEIIDSAIVPEVERRGVPRARFDAARSALKTAVAEHQTWLDTVLVPNAKGDFRLGAPLYDQKMAFALSSPLDRPELKARALKAFADTRAEMERIARSFPDCATGSQQQAIECALAKSYANRATRETLEQAARDTLAQATAFTARQGFVTMPSGPVQVITMPKFQQGNSVAYDDPPGPLEQDQPNFYAVSPIPDDWTDEQATSFLTEYNTYMLHDLSIHEGVPGHYLQLDHANKNDDLLRAVLMSGPFVEGWAVYAEEVMADAGYLDNDPLFRLTVLKMRLRSIINTVLDIGIHTEGMTREQAMQLMMEGGFQQEREAAGKWLRANLSSAQLLSYFTGYSEHMALREEAKRRWGEDYSLRRYNDAVLSHGSIPVKHVRALMFGLPID
ncbi:DUF885 domain-containing protein [Altericroceibacterium xinjiangense]|uniref:DUF885 domain-containing protein n=1 Tax=Altericroceibacterium xinjiangense TaxID=762261 RepID=UPI000F7F6041|nr:DUF885 domain-containing protein [Altericroceibacterium xinjiangense]